VWEWLVAKMILEALYVFVLIVFYTVCYAAIADPFTTWFNIFGTFYLAALATGSLVYICAAVFDDFSLVFVVVILVIIVEITFAGMTPTLTELRDRIPTGYVLSHFTYSRWAFERLMLMEFQTLDAVWDSQRLAVLNTIGLPPEASPQAYATSFSYLFFVNILFFRLIAYVLLVFCNSHQRRPISSEWRRKHMRDAPAEGAAEPSSGAPLSARPMSSPLLAVPEVTGSMEPLEQEPEL